MESRAMRWLTARPAREALIVAAAAPALIALFYAGGRLAPLWKTAAGLLVPNLLLWLPLGLIVYSGRNAADFGLTTRNWRLGLRWGFGAAAVTLPLFLLGAWLFWRVAGHRPPVWRFDLGLLTRLPVQLVAVALPEEVFFRGYLQTLFSRAWPARSRPLIGADGAAILAASACFAVAHLAAEPRLYRLSVFFPGLLFGFLRARTGTIAAPIVLHTLANLAIYVLDGGV
ncbi:MAG: CPBP family intramembrane metalloprotease [Myxococcales bacterium]|nr:CPBP family intramembrane metalloprotease [Myxococcales bacterium]